jgi:hypothetical protein
LARILVDSLVLFPCYVIGTVFLGLFNYLFNYFGYVGSCYDPKDFRRRVPQDECAAIWHKVSAVETAAMVFNIIAL